MALLAGIKNKLYVLLKKSEAIFKTDMVYLVQGGFWLTSQRVMVSLCSFVLTIVLAYFFSKESFGTYKYVLSIGGLLSVATLRGMDSAIAQAVARGHDGSIHKALTARIKFGLLGLIASILLSAYYYLNDNSVLAISFLLISIFIPFMDSFGIYGSVLNGKKLFKLVNTFQSAGQLIAMVALILVATITQNIYILIVTYFATWTLLRWFFYRRTLSTVKTNSLEDPETISYGKHGSVIGAIAVLITSLDDILIFHFLGASDLARFTFAMAPTLQITSLFNQLTTLAMPKLAQQDAVSIQKILIRRMKLLLIGGIVIALLYIICAPYFFNIFFPRYIDVIKFSQLFALYIIIAIPQTMINAAINAKITSIPKKMLWLWNIPGVLGAVTTLILIAPYGLTGAIIARLLCLITAVFVCVVMWKLIKKTEAAASVTKI